MSIITSAGSSFSSLVENAYSELYNLASTYEKPSSLSTRIDVEFDQDYGVQYVLVSYPNKRVEMKSIPGGKEVILFALEEGYAPAVAIPIEF